VHGAYNPDDRVRALKEECGADRCYNAAINLFTFLNGENVGENCKYLGVVENGNPARGVWKHSLPYFLKHTGIIY
jgi:hypothetical protein